LIDYGLQVLRAGMVQSVMSDLLVWMVLKDHEVPLECKVPRERLDGLLTAVNVVR